ncbi:uncharacterized protein LOC130980412 [Arachis stenosperma]|uniref:uncharacterized protein LOC130980412 n=1 Tax=Arachis stenosperma TaxID=217475 RepID=UPI0025AC8B17|nr:uncharacterized protein LOC130980412 [Arachis stenosperma]
MARRRRNRIESLQDDNGVWITESSALEDMATSFFKNLYIDDMADIPFVLSTAFPMLSNEELESFGRNISADEIKDSLFSIGALKAPGKDGMQAIFYQNKWDLIGTDLCQLVQKIFQNPQEVKDINETLITLIPKVEPVMNLKQMRPISLCNVSYKVITKILARRLKGIMGKLTQPTQCSFVPGRQSSDNIVIVQEVIHSMKSKKGKKGWMAIKIDLEKAYDRLKWSFIVDTLKDIGMPDHFINLVYACISTARMRVLWNGEALDEFSPSRGIRQGDPLSPYIFVLCIERLSQLISVAVDTEVWNPISLSRDGPKLSHLCFADDMILFAEASMEQADVIKKVLEAFCNSSGQRVNNEKTRVFFSNNINHNIREGVSEVLQFSRTNDLGKYLGVPLLHSRVTDSTYKSIINNLEARLNGWKARTLSLAGRATLVKSILTSLPSYTMQTALLPSSTCNLIDSNCRKFLRGKTGQVKKTHLLSWRKVNKPKNSGGLGIRHAKDLNHAFMMKMGWGLATKKDCLWARVLRSKYKCGNDIIPVVGRKKNDSNIWKGIWDWDANKLRTWLPEELVEKIIAMTPPSPWKDDDQLAWNLSSDGTFKLRSAYNSLDRNPSMPVQVFKYVWKWNGPERIRYLLWLVANEAILTNATRARRHMTNIANCPRCNAEEETTIHILRDCQFAKKVWSSLVPQDHLSEFFNTDLPEWILINLSQRGNWPCTFGMGISALWYDRNKLVFEGKISAPGMVAISIHKRTTEVLNCLRKNLIKEQANRSDHLIRWIPPPESIIKINVDGLFYSHNNNAACGGVFRDQWGRFLKGFSCNLGSCSIMHAELWAVIKGLQIAMANDIHHVIIESDSKMALNFVRNGCLDSHPCATLIKDINILAGRIPSIKWNHIFREANTVADCLAKKGHELRNGLHIFDAPLPDSLHFLFSDFHGCLRLRGPTLGRHLRNGVPHQLTPGIREIDLIAAGPMSGAAQTKWWRSHLVADIRELEKFGATVTNWFQVSVSTCEMAHFIRCYIRLQRSTVDNDSATDIVARSEESDSDAYWNGWEKRNYESDLQDVGCSGQLVCDIGGSLSSSNNVEGVRNLEAANFVPGRDTSRAHSPSFNTFVTRGQNANIREARPSPSTLVGFDRYPDAGIAETFDEDEIEDFSGD